MWTWAIENSRNGSANPLSWCREQKPCFTLGSWQRILRTSTATPFPGQDVGLLNKQLRTPVLINCCGRNGQTIRDSQKNIWKGCLGGSVGWASDSRFRSGRDLRRVRSSLVSGSGSAGSLSSAICSSRLAPARAVLSLSLCLSFSLK